MSLGKDMIKEPRMWRLVLEPTPASLCAMAFSPYEHHAMISEEIPFGPEMSPLKALQEAVYANPLLLSDFNDVTVLVASRRFLVVSDTVDTPEKMSAVFAEAYAPAHAPAELIADTLPGMNMRIIMELPADTLGFLRRTFNNPRIAHPLTPQALYFHSKYQQRVPGKMLVNLRGDRCDIVVLGDGAPMLLNSYEIHHPMDAVYYVMAVRKEFDIPPSQEIILAGDTASRGDVAPQLRRFVRYVMPAIFPSAMFRAGRASLRTPFEMVVSPLTL